MITLDGWFDWMEQIPGPSAKVWPDPNTNEGVVFHSAVGSFQGVINVVLGPASNLRSVTGVVSKTGRAVQFYSVFYSPWANGSREANRRFLGFEHEGGRDVPAEVSEPLTQPQIDFDIHVLRDLQAFKGSEVSFWRRPTSPTDKSASLWEHKEMTRFGADPTACPSGRIPWITIIQQLGGGSMNLGDGWELRGNGNFLETVRNGFVVQRLGSTDGAAGSRISKPWGDPNSGGHWLWQRTDSRTGETYWSAEEGD